MRIDGTFCRLFLYRSIVGKFEIYDKNATKESVFNDESPFRVVKVNRLLNDELKNYQTESDCGGIFGTQLYTRSQLGFWLKNYEIILNFLLLV